MNKAQWAMIRKDVIEITGSSQTIVPLVLVPLLIMVVFPAALMVGAQFGQSGMVGINGFDQMVRVFGDLFAGMTPAQTMITIGVNIFFPTMFLLIPVMCASIMGASSFVGEKEHKTLESLMYTPLSLRELFVAKVAGTVLVSYLTALVTVIAFGIVVDIGGRVYFGHLIFPNLKWLILIFWVTPGVTVLGVAFMVRVSAKANTFQDAQQMAAFVVLPILLLVGGQATGLFLLDEPILLGVGLLIAVIDFFLLRGAARGYVPEKLL